MASFRLDDRVAVLTGRGLGAGFAHALGAVGAELVLAARRTAEHNNVATVLRTTGLAVVSLQVDVRDPDDAATVVGAAIRVFGRLDALVNKPGIGLTNSHNAFTPEIFVR